MAYGFEFAYRLCGAGPTIVNLLCKDTETLSKGDLVTLESGEVDLAATDDAGIIGVCLKTADGTDSTTRFPVIIDEDAVYAVDDANARMVGDKLDIAGTTGAMTVATDSNHDLVVVAESTASERTLVRIIHGAHPFSITKTA